MPPKTFNDQEVFWKWNIYAAFLHLLNAIIMVVLFYIPDEDDVVHKDVCYNITQEYAGWSRNNATIPDAEENFSITANRVYSHTLSLHWLIVTFHILSFIFQLIPALFDDASPWRLQCLKTVEYPYIELVIKHGRNPIRFVEYAASASIMLVCIGLLTGVRDFSTLFMIAALCANTQFMGLLSEYDENRWAEITHTVIGWITLMVAYGVIFTYYGVANAQAVDGYEAPWFVHVIVISMFVLFNSFGIVHLCRVCGNKNDEEARKNIEVSYVTLSIVAKTLLGWLIYGSVMAMGAPCE